MTETSDNDTLPATSPNLVVALADGRVGISWAGGDFTEFPGRLDARRLGAFFVSHSLFVSEDGSHAYVLDGAAGEIWTFSIQSPDEVAQRWQLPEAGTIRYSALASAANEALYAIGDVPGECTAPDRCRSEGVILVAVVGRDGSPVREFRLEKERNRDWPVYQAALDPVGQWLYLSYHGATSTGVDAVDLSTGTWAPCPELRQPAACGPGHGGLVFEPIKRKLYIASGGPIVLELDPVTLREVASIETGLDRGHPMELAATSEHLVLADDCGKRGGIAVVALSTATASPLEDRPCTARVALSKEGWLALAPTSGPRASVPPSILSSFSFLLPKGQLLIKSLPELSTVSSRILPAEAVDLAFLPKQRTSR